MAKVLKFLYPEMLFCSSVLKYSGIILKKVKAPEEDAFGECVI